MPKPLYSSASALETADPKADGCYRKEYFLRKLKLPTLPKGSSTFGDVIHAVAERFDLADENGNVDGKPVELYPENWERPLNRFTGKHAKEAVSLEEQALIKVLINKAIEEGVLMREAGRQPEKKITFSPVDGVVFNGYIDLLTPTAIRDHKSTKSMKWAKSVKRKKDGTWPKNALALNIQMNLYAYWYYTKGGYDKSKPLALSHQYFVKDMEKPHVEKREVNVTWEEVNKFFTVRILPVLEMMIVYRDVEKWQDIPLPCNVSASCRKYGGCEFQSICTEQETVECYKKRIERELTGNNTTNYKQVAEDLQKGGETMAESPMMQKLRKAQEAKRERENGTTAAPKEEAVKKEVAETPVEKKPEATAPEAAGQQKAPWHSEKCPKCKNNLILGFDDAGTAPCKMCDIFTGKDGGKKSGEFVWDVSDDGKLTVMDGETGEEITVSPVGEATAKDVVADEAPVEEAPTEEQSAVEEPVEKKPEAPATPPAVETDDEPAVKQSGAVFESPEIVTTREKFTLIIGCAITESKVKGGGKFGTPSCRITGEELLATVSIQMQEILGTVKWQRMNSFDRRAAVEVFGKEIAEMLGGSDIVCARVPKASLLETIVMSVRPYAGKVIQALAD